MKEGNGKTHSGIRNRKYYFYVILGGVALILAAAIIIVSIAISKRNSVQVENPGTSAVIDSGKEGDDGGNEPVVVNPDEFCNPVATVSVIHDYGFYKNETLNKYYEHQGVDFAGKEGDQVYAVLDGTVEAVYTSDILVGSQIIIDHGNGVKTVYEFIEPKEGLKAGDKVSRGDVIANVAAATGNEYKDGPHLHFEVMEDDKVVDPAKYLTFEEK